MTVYIHTQDIPTHAMDEDALRRTACAMWETYRALHPKPPLKHLVVPSKPALNAWAIYMVCADELYRRGMRVGNLE